MTARLDQSSDSPRSSKRRRASGVMTTTVGPRTETWPNPLVATDSASGAEIDAASSRTSCAFFPVRATT